MEASRQLVNRITDEARDTNLVALDCFLKSFDTTSVNYRYDKLSSIQTNYHQSLECSVYDENGNKYRNCFENSNVLLNTNNLIEATKKGVCAKAEKPDYEVCKEQTVCTKNIDFDSEEMIGAIDSFIAETKERYPLIKFKSIKGVYLQGNNVYGNTDRGLLVEEYDKYQITAMFVASNGVDASNLKAYSVSTKDLRTPLIEIGAFEEVLRTTQKAIQELDINVDNVDTIIFMPDAVEKILQCAVEAFLSEKAIASKKGRWNNFYKKKVASDFIHLASVVNSEDVISDGRVLSRNGFYNEDIDIINTGILENYCVEVDENHRNGIRYIHNDFDSLSMNGGGETYKSKISSLDRGLYVSRIKVHHLDFSGDITMMVKNAIVIENGIERGSLKTVYLSFNLYDFFNEIQWLSIDRACSGNCSLPWIALGKECFRINS